MPPPRIAVIIVSYNHAKYLRDAFRSLAEVEYPRDLWKIFLVDNNSSDETVSLVRAELIDEARGKTFQGDISASLLAWPENFGFAGGNNTAIKQAMKEDFDYVYLLNPDTVVESNFLGIAVDVAKRESNIGVVQSRLVLEQDRSRLNSWGNEIHFLGFSFSGGNGELIDSPEAIQKLQDREIATSSGAAMMIRVAVLRLVGLFDETLFAYHEDVDLSWRVRLAGFKIMLASQSIVYHKYEFSRSIKKYYFMERNRFLVNFKNYKIKTLILIFPALLVMELGLWVFAILSGWRQEKWRAYTYFFSYKNLRDLFRARRSTQRMRVVGDSAIVRLFSSRISYQEIANPMWKYFGNYLFAFYWLVVRLLIFW